MLKYGVWSCRYFYDEYQRRAVAKGALKRGYLSDDVDEDFYLLAESYKEARDGVLLYGLDYDDATAMALAKTVWKASRNQFKYMLAMNDVLIKAEIQMSLNDGDRVALAAMNGEMIEYKYANTQFALNSESFWTLFTEPSLKAMLHYSVNSYTDTPVFIQSPLAIAALAYDVQKANG